MIPPNNREIEIRVSLMILFCAGVCVCVTANMKVGRKNLANTKAEGGGVEED